MSADIDLAGSIQNLIAEKITGEAISRETDLLAGGVLDSVTLVQLILHLEEGFGVRIELGELEIDDLRSVHSIANLVAKLRSAALEDDLVLTRSTGYVP